MHSFRFQGCYNAYKHFLFCFYSSAAHRQLRRRMFLVERLKDANVVGLVVGTLEIRGYRDAVERVRRLCKTAAKKLYVFSIGKLNEAKLSNFAADIDAFILLSCPFGVVLDAGDFYKPLVTLFEAEIALNSDKQWFAGAGWTAEFGAFLNGKQKKRARSPATFFAACRRYWRAQC